MKTFLGLWLTGMSVPLLLACSAGSGPSPTIEVGEGSSVETSEEALVGNALSPAQAATALKLIDDICGDTWCSGDYNFGFRRLNCNRRAQSCTLTLQVFPREGVPSSTRSYWRSCKTFGFDGFGSLVHTANNGYQSLDEDYYDALTECTTRIVSHLP
ncbi:MAG TPA: hypothetical protein VER11_18335 [Polyangiaceae bacterium]|nr:hypothetical protein [Polyangiaceae bacterium]